MKKPLSILLISLLLFAGMSFAILKYPSTSIKINTTTKNVTNETTNQSNIKIMTTIIPSVNTTSSLPNGSEINIKPTTIIGPTNIIKTQTNDSTNIIPTCATCSMGKIPQLIANATLNQSCSPSDVGGLLHYSHGYGEHAHFDMPAYLDDVREDCDLLGLDEQISDDLEAKLANVSLIEAEINEIENESQALVDRGLDAIECLREVHYTPPSYDEETLDYIIEMEPIYGRSYPSFPLRSHIGNSYSASGIFDYVAGELENFNYAYENVYTGYSYTAASMENLENITLGLEDMCRSRACVWPEDKDFYESLLAYEQGSASYYANTTKLFIDDARDFAQYYHDLKGNIDRVECLEFMSPTTAAPWMNMILENVTNDTPKKVISPVKLAANFSDVTNVSLIGGDKPKYVIKSKVKKKLLWVFEVQVETKAEVNAENGDILSEEKPWWNFLLTN